MDPLTLGLLGAQALFGAGQTIAGLAKPRKKIDTSIQPEYKQAEEIARNAAQSTSASYELARQSMGQEAASARAAALRSSGSVAGLMRAQQQISRAQQSSIGSLYQSELREKSNELQSLRAAKMATAGAKERMQGLKNQLAMQENAAKDQLISAGIQNVFGALSGGVAAQQNEQMMDLYRGMYGTGGASATGAAVGGGNPFMNVPGYRTQLDINRRLGR
jgi:hypothetical protein